MPGYRLIAGVILWSTSVVCGFWIIALYENEPAKAQTGMVVWPEGVNLPVIPSKMPLLLFIHPKCPCTRATLSELDRLLPDISSRVSPILISYEPSDPALAVEWRNTINVRYFDQTPGVQKVFDKRGDLARKFGVSASGALLLFDTDGKLLFQGGITSSRGHEGANPIQDSLVDLIRDGSGSPVIAPVFGCSLFE